MSRQQATYKEVSCEIKTSHDTGQRSKVLELSRKWIGKRSVQTQYKAGYGYITVTSIFNDAGVTLEDLFYEILQEKVKNKENACYNREATDLRYDDRDFGGEDL